MKKKEKKIEAPKENPEAQQVGYGAGKLPTGQDCQHQWFPLTAKVKEKIVPTFLFTCLKCGDLKIGKRTIRISRFRLDMDGKPIKNLGLGTADTDAARRSEAVTIWGGF